MEGAELQSGQVQSDEGTNPTPVAQAEGDNYVPRSAPETTPESSIAVAGEKFTGFRQALKRYNKHAVQASAAQADAPGNTQNVYRNELVQPAIPYPPGYEPVLGVNSVPGMARGNYCCQTMFSYILPCFAGWRGSIRWKTVPICYCTDCIGTQTVARCGTNCDYSQNFDNVEVTVIDPAGSVSSAIAEYFTYLDYNGWDGAAIAISNVNCALEWEIPYYNRFRFQTYNHDVAKYKSEGLGFRWRAEYCGGGKMFFNTYCAAGEDFNAFFFRGVPCMWDNDLLL
jgi:hypothetical protein